MAQWRKVVVSGSTAELNDISASGDIVPVTPDGGALGTQYFEWSDAYFADSSKLYFGDDQDTTLTHTDGSGLLLNSTNRFGFGTDFNEAIYSSTGDQLDILATTELEITTPTVALNTDGQVLAFGVNDDVSLTHVHNIGLLLNGAMGLSFRDATLQISSSADGQLDIEADTVL